MVECPRLNYLLNDTTEIGFTLVQEDLFPDCPVSMNIQMPGLAQQYKHDWNNSKHQDIGLAWLVARGYTANKLKELEEDMPKILAYLRNVQTAKAIEAL